MSLSSYPATQEFYQNAGKAFGFSRSTVLRWCTGNAAPAEQLRITVLRLMARRGRL